MDAGDLSNVALKFVHQGDDLVIDATVGDRLDDDGENIDADAEFLRNEAAVSVVTGILTKFGDAGMGVADANIAGLEPSPDAESEAAHGDGDGGAGAQTAGKPSPKTVSARPTTGDPVGVAFRQAEIRKQNGEKEKVGDDDDADAEAGGDGELVDRLDFDDEHREEADGIG